VAAAEKAKVVYVYDFGDDWRHDIVVEKIAPAEPWGESPRSLGLGPVVQVDTSGEVDMRQLIARLDRVLSPDKAAP